LTVYCLPLSVTSLILSIEYTTKDWDLLSPYCGLSYFISQARVPPFTSQTTFHKFHFVCSFSRHTCPYPQKNYTTQQKLRQPCRKRQPSAALIPLSLHSGLPAAAALSPLATARASPSISRPNTPFHSAVCPPAFGRLRAALPALFSASPTHSPRPPTPKGS